MQSSRLRVLPKKIAKGAPPLVCPPDKSVTHRAFLFSLLSPEKSVVRRPLLGQDCLASLEAVRKLGAKVGRHDELIELTGFGVGDFLMRGSKGAPLVLDCQNSGTTMRLLSGLLAGQNGYFHLFGDASLTQRPMARVAKPLAQMGAAIFPRGEKRGTKSSVPTPPIDIELAIDGLRAIDYVTPVASAQVKSAVLLAGLFCREGRTTVTEPSISRDHTERMLRVMGVDVKSEILDGQCARVAIDSSAGRMLAPLSLTVGGDPSSAAFWAAASVMQGQPVSIRNVLLNDTRLGFAVVLGRMGARVTLIRESNEGGEDVGSVEITPSSLVATEVVPTEIPTLIDEVPMLAIASLWGKGTTVFRGVQELRMKESDRLEAILSFIRSIGGNAWAEGDDLFVEGIGGPPAGPRASGGDWFYETLGDHRLAMAAVITADALRREIVLDDADCIKVSYPDFFEHREALS